MVKKFFILTLLIGACSALPPAHIKVFGNIVTKGLQRVRYVGTKLASISADPLKESKVTFKFPQVKFFIIETAYFVFIILTFLGSIKIRFHY